jgi:hypothetical protein
MFFDDYKSNIRFGSQHQIRNRRCIDKKVLEKVDFILERYTYEPLHSAKERPV